jgi:hypothetical protein
MQLGETIATYDVALALRGESGKFDVTSPTGDMYHLTCTPNHSITNLRWSGNGMPPQPFLIRKVAEPVSPLPESTSPNGTGTTIQAPVAKTPFLIATGEIEAKSEERAGSTAMSFVPEPEAEPEEIINLDLVYVEGEPNRQQPTAWVCLGSGLPQDRRKMMTNACLTFNEFDAEIRRLHANLDDIRYRARKKFYQAQAVATGA